MTHERELDTISQLLSIATTKTEIDKVLDRAWQLLPKDAAVANTKALKMVQRRRDQLQR
jgi:hypothetical protein